MILFTLNRKNSEPLYEQLICSLRQTIQSGQLKYGSLLPSESDLAALYEVSLFVVKKAYHTLSNEKYIQTLKGKGTFVIYHPHFAISSHQLHRLSSYEGVTLGSRTYSVFLRTTILQDDYVYSLLDLPTNEPCHVIKRIGTIDNNPVVLQYFYFPSRYYKNIDELSNQNVIISSLEEKVKSIKSTFTASSINSVEGSLLELPVNAPCHFIRTLLFNETHAPVGLLISVFPGEFSHVGVRFK